MRNVCSCIRKRPTGGVYHLSFREVVRLLLETLAVPTLENIPRIFPMLPLVL